MTEEKEEQPTLSSKDKLIFGGYVITILAGLQGLAWYLGHDGVVFATTSAIIGLTAGALLGFTYNKKE